MLFIRKLPPHSKYITSSHILSDSPKFYCISKLESPVCIVFFQVSYHPDGVGGGREESSSKTTTLCEEKQIMIRDKDARQLPLIEEHLM